MAFLLHSSPTSNMFGIWNMMPGPTIPTFANFSAISLPADVIPMIISLTGPSNNSPYSIILQPQETRQTCQTCQTCQRCQKCQKCQPQPTRQVCQTCQKIILRLQKGPKEPNKPKIQKRCKELVKQRKAYEASKEKGKMLVHQKSRLCLGKGIAGCLPGGGGAVGLLQKAG